MKENIDIGQEWYCFTNSTTYVIYKIDIYRFEYVDGELIQENMMIGLKSMNTTKEISPEKLLENYKLIKDVKAAVKPDIHLTGIPIPTRLDDIE